MVEILKILILEDNQSDADLLQRELKKSGLIYTSQIVQTRGEFENGLENFKPDLILADYSLPSFDGSAAFIIKQNTYPDIPFIIVSGVIGEENAVELIKNGITDYALKDKLFVLLPKIKRALKEAKEKKEKRITDKQLALQKEDNEEQFKVIFNDAPMGIAIIDSLNGKLFNINPMFAKIVGRTIAEMTNIDWMSITHPDDIQLDLNNRAQLLAGEINGYRMEKRYIHPDGSFVWINMTISKILNHDKSNPRNLCMIEDITERKRAEQELIIANKELKQANERFELIGEATNDGLWDFNLETNQIWSNERHQQLYGLSLADPVPNYEEWKQRIHPEDRERTVKVVEETMASERNNCITEYRFNTQNIGWMNIYGRTLINRNKEGKPVRLIGSMMDITERKKNERELSKNENHLRVILQTNPECIKLIGTNGKLEDMNSAGLAMIEADSFEQIKGKSLFDVIDKPYWSAFSQLTQNVFEGKSGNLEFEITGLKGTHRWMETHAVPLKDAEDKIIFLLGTTRDITERKKTEKEILRVIERYDMIAKATSDTIWDWDITNDKILYSEGITNMFGYEKTKIENITGWWKTKIHPDDLEIVQEAIAAAFKKHSYNLQLEYRFRCADESFKYIYDRAFIIYDEHKKPCRMIGAMQDVNKLKESEISLNELNDNLQKQNKELIKTNKELDHFVYSVSHDLRSPLTSVLGLLYFIEEESQETDTLEHVKMIRNSINRLDLFIKNILNYSRNNRTIVEVENIPLQKTAVETVNSLHDMKEAKGIDFEIEIKERQPFYSDRLRFNTILENLISNAIKYHKKDKSGSYIKITGQSDHEKLQLIIADNGIGIEPAHHNKIFDIFFRLSGNTDGTGIGLYIVKETVEILQGSIQIQSEKGTGTIFTITLKNLKP